MVSREYRTLSVALRAEGGGTDPRTGEPIYVPTGKQGRTRTVDPKTGKVTWVESGPKTVKVERGTRIPGTSVTDPVTGRKIPVRDAYDLVSGSERTPRALEGHSSRTSLC